MASNSKPHPLETFPTELLLLIFSFAANSFDPKQEPSIDVGNCSPWSKDLRIKKAVVRVCKRWRSVALPQLYRRIYLHQVGQLCALVKVLEESAAGKQDGGGYGGWVQHIHGNLYVPANWETVYVRKIQRLLTLCSSSLTLLWRVFWDKTDEEPSSKDSSTICLICPASPQKPIFHSTLSSLQKLSLSFDALTPHLDHSSNPLVSTASFENLEGLTCEGMKPAALQTLDFVSRGFRMPNLLSLTISIPWHAPARELNEREVASMFRVLEHHGQRLTALVLDTLPILRSMRKNVGDILTLCPNIESLRCSDRVFSAVKALDTPFRPLRKLELLTHEINLHGPPLETRVLEGLLVMSRNRDNFPRLESVAVFDHMFPGSSMTQCIFRDERDIFFQYFLSWTRKFRETGIALLSLEGEPMISANQERWNGWTKPENDGGDVGQDQRVDTEPEDASYVYESEPDSTSEVSSDSHSHSEWSVHSVGSIEALELFKNSIQDDYSDVESSVPNDESDDDAEMEDN